MIYKRDRYQRNEECREYMVIRAYNDFNPVIYCTDNHKLPDIPDRSETDILPVL